MNGILVNVGIFLAGAIFSAGGLVAILRVNGRDLNGLGRLVRRTIACDLRCAAEEIPISKIKLLHLADLIDPR